MLYNRQLFKTREKADKTHKILSGYSNSVWVDVFLRLFLHFANFGKKKTGERKSLVLPGIFIKSS
jgi:hypothetical protein